MIRRKAMAEGSARRGRWPVVLALVAGVPALVAVAWFARAGYLRLSEACAEITRIRDVDSDVTLNLSGSQFRASTVMHFFGLTNGTRLADLDFAALRERALAKFPVIRDLRVTRRLPNGVVIDLSERDPVVRVSQGGMAGGLGLVADEDGVVFRGGLHVSSLPLLRVSRRTALRPGTRLSGNAAAALRLSRELSDEAFRDLRVQEIDSSRPDSLEMTLGDYSVAFVAWEGMADDSRKSRDSLRRQLTRLKQAIDSRVGSGAKRWDATDWAGGCVYAHNPAWSMR